jgi:hypothetical protein
MNPLVSVNHHAERDDYISAKRKSHSTGQAQLDRAAVDWLAPCN